MTARLAPRLLALAALTLCLVLLAAASNVLPGPPGDPRSLPGWWTSTDAALALGALLRLIAGVLCAWLLVVTAVELLATLTGRVRTARLVGSFAPAAWRALVLRPLAAGTLAVPVLVSPLGVLAPSAAATSVTVVDDPAPTDVGPAVLTMSLCEEDHEHHHGQHPAPTTSTTVATTSTTSTTTPLPTTTTTVAPAPADPPTTTTTVEPDDPTTSLPATTERPTTTTTVHPEELHDHTMIPPAPLEHLRPTDPTPPAPPTGAHDLHVVVPGDSFWRIAAQRVESHLGRAPSAREVATYWTVLVEANADRLAVPGNPDLIFPGDEVVLPPL